MFSITVKEMQFLSVCSEAFFVGLNAICYRDVNAEGHEVSCLIDHKVVEGTKLLKRVSFRSCNAKLAVKVAKYVCIAP